MKTSTESRAKMRETVLRIRRGAADEPIVFGHILDMIDLILDDLDELLGELAAHPPCVGSCRERDPKNDVIVPGPEAARLDESL